MRILSCSLRFLISFGRQRVKYAENPVNGAENLLQGLRKHETVNSSFVPFLDLLCYNDVPVSCCEMKLTRAVR